MSSAFFRKLVSRKINGLKRSDKDMCVLLFNYHNIKFKGNVPILNHWPASLLLNQPALGIPTLNDRIPMFVQGFAIPRVQMR